MTEVVVRNAWGFDGPRFRDLWRLMLEELYLKGVEVKPTDRTLDFYMDIFDLYTLNKADGAVGVVDLDGKSVGAIMWGSGTIPIDFRYGKCAIGWGTTVDSSARGLGLSRLLRRWASFELRTKGFDCLCGSVQRFNAVGMESFSNFGGVPSGTTYYLPLESVK